MPDEPYYRNFNFGPEVGSIGINPSIDTASERNQGSQIGRQDHTILIGGDSGSNIIITADGLGGIGTRLVGFEGERKSSPLDPGRKAHMTTLYEPILDMAFDSLFPNNPDGPTHMQGSQSQQIPAATFFNCSNPGIINQYFQQILQIPCLTQYFPFLRQELIAAWGKVTIACVNCSSTSSSLAAKKIQGKNTIALCDPTYFNLPIDQQIAILFHELLHIQGATELDSEILENICFKNKGATLPTSQDWLLFKGGPDEFRTTPQIIQNSPVTSNVFHTYSDLPFLVYVGKWFIWDPATGRIWLRQSYTSFTSPMFVLLSFVHP